MLFRKPKFRVGDRVEFRIARGVYDRGTVTQVVKRIGDITRYVIDAEMSGPNAFELENNLAPLDARPA